MDYKHYQTASQTTALYHALGKTDEGLGLWYPALGLVGEAGEVSEKVKKLYRDHDGVMPDGYKIAIASELGDVLWYLTNLSVDLGIELEDIGVLAAQRSYDGARPEFGLWYLTMCLMARAGTVVESIEKLYCDTGGDVASVDRNAMSLKLADVLWHMVALAKQMGITLDEIADANLAKLASRMERGVTHGSGDNR